MTERLYNENPYLLEFHGRIVGRRDEKGEPAVLLDRTAFYPESGGQPSDTGTLGSSRVVRVFESGEEIVHVLSAPLSGDEVSGKVDAERREHFRQQHHGQHLLSRSFLEVASALTVSVHMGDENCSIDLDREVSEEEIALAESRTNQIIWESRPVRVRTVSRAEAEDLGLRPALEAGDAIRLVEASGFDLQPCCGTHPRNTAEVGVALVLGSERYKAGTRIRFACGHLALRRARSQGTILAELQRQLSSPEDAIASRVEAVLSQLVAEKKRSAELLDKAMEGEARRLFSLNGEKPGVVRALYEGWPAEDLRILATKLTHLEKCVALLGSRTDKASIVFAQSEGLPHDIPALVREAAQRLGGKGGGRGNLAQGGGEKVSALEETLDAALTRVAGA